MPTETFDVKKIQSPLDENQIIKTSFDDAEEGGCGALRTELVNGMIPPVYDYVAVAYPSSAQEVYTFYIGGSSGTLEGTVTINYTDSTKANLLNVTRS
jgi:hypothetical protein